MDLTAAAAYGETHAPVYDRLYGARFDGDGAVRALATAAAGGRVLELGLGTGRLALGLVDAGVEVDGIEASPAMIEILRSRPGGERIGVFAADLGGFELPRRDYAVAVCAVSTLFMLEPQAQAGCLTSTHAHLADGGRLFVEAFVPDPSRFDRDGRRVEHRPAPDGGAHEVRSTLDVGAQTIAIEHRLDGAKTYRVTLHYRTPAELDSLAERAGFAVEERWDDWSGRPADEHSRDPVRVYRR